MTGGLCFRPSTIEEGLSLFEQEAFLMYDQRRRSAPYRGAIDEETIESQAASAVFDTKADNAVIAKAGNSRIPLAHPRYIIYQNRAEQIPDARRRRILRELHAAAAVQDKNAVGRDPEGKLVQLFDPDLRIYTHRSQLDEWRVYIRGLDGTPYAHPETGREKWWALFVTFPNTYPIRPPVFRFVPAPYHMNISMDGRICLNLIEKGYLATAAVVELIQNIKQLFLEPDLDTPIDLMKRDLFKENRAEYERLARESTLRIAKDSPDEWLVGSTVDQDVPSDFSIELKGDHVPQYMRSQMSGKYVPVDQRVIAEDGIMVSRDEYLRRGRAQPTNIITGQKYRPTDEDYLPF
jgi:ubiquitin-conjugating enzyme E2 D/E